MRRFGPAMFTPTSSHQWTMSTPRRLARTLAFQTLFELEERLETDLEETLSRRAESLLEEDGTPLDARSLAFVRRLVEGALARRETIDAAIQRAAPAFPVAQLGS